MTITIPTSFRRFILVFAGVFSAALFDLTVNSRGQNTGLLHALTTPDNFIYAYLAGWLCVLGLMSLILERYVRPLSRIGALSTGFCGYALISFLLL